MDNTIYYPPRSDSGWLGWGSNACPMFIESASELGLSDAQTAAAQTAFDLYSTAWHAAKALATRGPARTEAKNLARRAFHDSVKPLVAIVRTNPAVNDAQRVELGIRPRDVVPTPAPVPTIFPGVELMLTGPQSIRVKTNNPLAPSVRAKPARVRQVAYFVHFGEGQPPADVATWQIGKLSGKTTEDFYWQAMGQPTTVWVACCYVNSRNQKGPFSTPIAIRVPGNGGVAAGASTVSTEGGTTPMAIAA